MNSKRASLGATQINAGQQLHRGSRVVPRDTERRHSYSDTSSVSSAGVNVCNCFCQNQDEEEEDRYVPRVVRVHAKQYNARPYTPEGRVLQRSKVLSSGCV